MQKGFTNLFLDEKMLKQHFTMNGKTNQDYQAISDKSVSYEPDEKKLGMVSKKQTRELAEISFVSDSHVSPCQQLNFYPENQFHK